jgi:hypothetical protein
MADQINDGGPAFPAPDKGESDYGSNNRGAYSGMSLRDHFAANALQGLCANPGAAFQANDHSGWGLVNCTDADLAALSYRIADAMLAARSAP